MPENDQIDDVAQLRTIINGLRVSGLSFVDQEALTYIQQRIKLLPSPEALTDMAGKRDLIKKVAAEVGEIVKLIEIYGKRNDEAKARSISTKGLPPRYKSLEWRQAMNKNSVIRDLVELSSISDKKGYTKLASNLIAFAKNVKEDAPVKIDEILGEITSSGDESLTKEAAFEGVKNWFGQNFGQQPFQKDQRAEKADAYKQQQQMQGAYGAAQKVLQNIASGKIDTFENLKNSIVTLPANIQQQFDMAQIENTYNTFVQGHNAFQAAQQQAKQQYDAQAQQLNQQWAQLTSVNAAQLLKNLKPSTFQQGYQPQPAPAAATPPPVAPAGGAVAPPAGAPAAGAADYAIKPSISTLTTR